MKLQQLGTNRTLVTFQDGTEIFYSYQTPVAGWLRGTGFFRTEEKFSVTTSKMIGEYLRRGAGFGIDAPKIPQEMIERIVKEHTK